MPLTTTTTAETSLPRRRGVVAEAVAAAPKRQTRSMARQAGGIEPPKQVWAVRSPSKKTRPVDHHATLEASDGLEMEADPKRAALRNSMSGREGPQMERQAAAERPRASRTPSRVRRFEMLDDPDNPFDDSVLHASSNGTVKMESPTKGRIGDFEFEVEPRRNTPSSLFDQENVVRQSSRLAEEPVSSSDRLASLSKRISLARARPDQSAQRESRPPLSPASTRRYNAGVATSGQPGGETRSPVKRISHRSTSPVKPLTIPRPFDAGDSASCSSASSRSKRPAVSPSVSDEALLDLGHRVSTAVASTSKYSSPATGLGKPADKVHRRHYSEHALAGSPVTQPDSSSRSRQADQNSMGSSATGRACDSYDIDAERQARRHSAMSIASPNASPARSQLASLARGNSAASQSPVRSSAPALPKIDYAALKPSPGKAKRGIFRHDEDEDNLEPAEVKHKEPAEEAREESQAAPSQTSGSPSKVTPLSTLSGETSTALAHLEASLARLAVPAHKRRSMQPAELKEESEPVAQQVQSPPKRELGQTRPKRLSPSKATSTAKDSADVHGLSRQMNALLSPRKASSIATSATGELENPFKAPLLPSTSSLLSRHNSSSSFVDKVSSDQRPVKEENVETQKLSERSSADAAADEAARRAAKAARRRSVHTIRSFQSSYALDGDSSYASSSSADLNGAPSEPANDSVSKPSKHARRRSMYVPTKREDWTGAGSSQESAGAGGGASQSSGLVVGSCAPVDGQSGTGTGTGTGTARGRAESKAARYLRGVVVLVDVRDQDGEEAGAAWVEMLKDAGARVRPPSPSAFPFFPCQSCSLIPPRHSSRHSFTSRSSSVPPTATSHT